MAENPTNNPTERPIDAGDPLEQIEREDRLKRSGAWPDDGRGDQGIQEIEALLAECRRRHADEVRENEPRYRRQRRREHLLLAALAALVMGVALWACMSTWTA